MAMALVSLPGDAPRMIRKKEFCLVQSPGRLKEADANVGATEYTIAVLDLC